MAFRFNRVKIERGRQKGLRRLRFEGALRGWRLEAMELGIGNAEFGKLKQREERIEQSVRKR
jgi:hypothetical protein